MAWRGMKERQHKWRLQDRLKSFQITLETLEKMYALLVRTKSGYMLNGEADEQCAGPQVLKPNSWKVGTRHRH
jgi:hypothetical protein